MTNRAFISEDEVQRALDYLRDNAGPAAEARANREYVEAFRSTIKAQIMAETPDIPIGAQERNACADERYISHLNAIRDAIEADEKNRFLREAALARIEAWRTMSSNERAMRL